MDRDFNMDRDFTVGECQEAGILEGILESVLHGAFIFGNVFSGGMSFLESSLQNQSIFCRSG